LWFVFFHSLSVGGRGHEERGGHGGRGGSGGHGGSEDDFRGGFGEESRGNPLWHNPQQDGWETYRGNPNECGPHDRQPHMREMDPHGFVMPFVCVYDL
jgi:hypothetical protein